MIDPKEIRLGNRFLMNYLGTKREIEVKGIFPDKIFFEDYWKEGDTFCKPESLDGITLTEEQFLRFEFKDYSDKQVKAKYILLETVFNTKLIISDEYTYLHVRGKIIILRQQKIKAHELQNIYFNLTGEELTPKELV